MRLQVTCVACFSSLSSPVRVQIISLLQEKGKMSVLEIVKFFSLTQPTISHHLKYLEQAQILKAERRGKKIYYSLLPQCASGECSIFS